MKLTVGWDIKGLDAYPELEAKRRFPTKKHILAKCPRHGETVDVVFSRKGRPICLGLHDKNGCDFCRASNFHDKKNIPESRRPQISEETSYWKNLKIKYDKM